MNGMHELKIQLLQAEKITAELGETIRGIVRPRPNEPVPVQALCAVCVKPVFSNDAVFTGGAHYHKNCCRQIEEVFKNGR